MIIALVIIIIKIIQGILLIKKEKKSRQEEESTSEKVKTLSEPNSDVDRSSDVILKKFKKRLNEEFLERIKLQESIDDNQILGVCTVCNLVISLHEEPLLCPACGAPAHRSHLLEWVKVRGFCPECSYHFSGFDIESLRKEVIIA